MDYYQTNNLLLSHSLVFGIGLFDVRKNDDSHTKVNELGLENSCIHSFIHLYKQRKGGVRQFVSTICLSMQQVIWSKNMVNLINAKEVDNGFNVCFGMGVSRDQFPAKKKKGVFT